MVKKARPARPLVEPQIGKERSVEEERQREADWAAIERISARNAEKDPDEELAFITEVVEEVRQEIYERGHCEKATDGH